MSDSDQQFPLGINGEVTVLVTNELTAKHMGPDSTQVFSTPEMVRLMERAAVQALASRLAPGQHSVGTSINVKHLALTPLGATVTAEAELIAVDGRRLTFKVTARDDIEVVGEGVHERALIDIARFEERANRKATAIAALAEQ